MTACPVLPIEKAGVRHGRRDRVSRGLSVGEAASQCRPAMHVRTVRQSARDLSRVATDARPPFACGRPSVRRFENLGEFEASRARGMRRRDGRRAARSNPNRISSTTATRRMHRSATRSARRVHRASACPVLPIENASVRKERSDCGSRGHRLRVAVGPHTPCNAVFVPFQQSARDLSKVTTGARSTFDSGRPPVTPLKNLGESEPSPARDCGRRDVTRAARLEPEPRMLRGSDGHAASRCVRSPARPRRSRAIGAARRQLHFRRDS